ncbi:hypothetical protein NDU88_004980 [Pleurodeles waltl]|uniref:Uncharacterized protein n=1 Tax=Pleurodeles waltl TaxID=8319 RepID=A0AAV7TTI2_PLEWA|nr:hypothetical protein NDU88_004980 [Pleurodeles waltl]
MEASKLSESSGAAVLHQASQLLSWRPHGMPVAFEGADLQCTSLYASYLLRPRCPSQCTGVRAPGVWSAEPRGLSAPETLNLGAADRACSRPPGPPLRHAEWRWAPRGGPGRPGRAPPAGVSMPFARRSRPEGGSRLGRGLVPRPASLPEGRRHSRAPDFELPESGGHQDTPRVPVGTKQDRIWQWIWADDGGVRSTLRVRPPS